MSSTTQVTTFSDLYTDLLNRTRQDTSTTATVTQAKRYINIGLQDMHVGFGEKFPWAERNAVLLTHAPYSDGSITLWTQGSASVTGSGTAWDTTNVFSQQNIQVGGKLRIPGEEETYEVSAVTGPTTLTLRSFRVGDSITSATEYTSYKDEFALQNDFLRPIDLRRFTSGPNPIDLVGRTDFYRRVGQNFTTGRPKVATLIDKAAVSNTTPVRKVVLYPAPDRVYQIHYRYVTSFLALSSAGAGQVSLSSDTDEPIVPLRYRHAIVLHALYHWYRDKKDDTRSGEAKSEYIDLVSRIAGDTEIGTQPARIQPRVASYRSRARRPWGGARRLGRYDVGGAFDRLEDLDR